MSVSPAVSASPVRPETGHQIRSLASSAMCHWAEMSDHLVGLGEQHGWARAGKERGLEQRSSRTEVAEVQRWAAPFEALIPDRQLSCGAYILCDRAHTFAPERAPTYRSRRLSTRQSPASGSLAHKESYSETLTRLKSSVASSKSVIFIRTRALGPSATAITTRTIPSQFVSAHFKFSIRSRLP